MHSGISKLLHAILPTRSCQMIFFETRYSVLYCDLSINRPSEYSAWETWSKPNLTCMSKTSHAKGGQNVHAQHGGGQLPTLMH